MLAQVSSWIAFAVVAAFGIRLVVRARRDRERSSADSVVRLGCATALIGFVLTIVLLVASFWAVGTEPDPSRKADVLARSIVGAWLWGKRLMPLGAVLAFAGGVLRAFTKDASADPKTFE